MYGLVPYGAIPIVQSEQAQGPKVRALVLSLGEICQITDAQLQTGKKPLVLFEGQIKERTATEGTPIIYDPALSSIRTLAASETLMI